MAVIRLDEDTEVLVEMMEQHRKDTEARKQALLAKRTKQLWIWTAALGFSYADLVGTVFVGMEYWAVGGAEGKYAARVMFGMIAGSLAVQAFLTNAKGSCSSLCNLMVGVHHLFSSEIIVITRISMSRGPVPFIFRYHTWSHSILSAWNSNFTGQGALATFVTIIGAKPLFDTWHVMMEKKVKITLKNNKTYSKVHKNFNLLNRHSVLVLVNMQGHLLD